MPQKVITEMTKYFAAFSGNVSDLTVKCAYVPDMSDYNELKDKLKKMQIKVEELETKMQILSEYISSHAKEVDQITQHSLQKTINVLAETEKHIANLVNDQLSPVEDSAEEDLIGNKVEKKTQKEECSLNQEVEKIGESTYIRLDGINHENDGCMGQIYLGDDAHYICAKCGKKQNVLYWKTIKENGADKALLRSFEEKQLDSIKVASELSSSYIHKSSIDGLKWINAYTGALVRLSME